MGFLIRNNLLKTMMVDKAFCKSIDGHWVDALPGEKENSYLKWLFYKEHNVVPTMMEVVKCNQPATR